MAALSSVVNYARSRDVPRSVVGYRPGEGHLRRPQDLWRSAMAKRDELAETSAVLLDKAFTNHAKALFWKSLLAGMSPTTLAS